MDAGHQVNSSLLIEHRHQQEKCRCAGTFLLRDGWLTGESVNAYVTRLLVAAVGRRQAARPHLADHARRDDHDSVLPVRLFPYQR